MKITVTLHLTVRNSGNAYYEECIEADSLDERDTSEAVQALVDKLALDRKIDAEEINVVSVYPGYLENLA